MKFIFTLLLMLGLSVSASWAKDYNDTIAVDFAGSVAKDTTTIAINNQSAGTYQLLIKNFVYSGAIAVGNVTLDSVKGTTAADGTITYSGEGDATLTDGDNPAYAGKWMASMLKTAHVTINEGKSYGDKLYLDITIQVSLMGMPLNIGVVFGNNQGVTDKIALPQSHTQNAVKVYSLDGRAVSSPGKGNVYIVKYADGSARKVAY